MGEGGITYPPRKPPTEAGRGGGVADWRRGEVVVRKRRALTAGVRRRRRRAGSIFVIVSMLIWWWSVLGGCGVDRRRLSYSGLKMRWLRESECVILYLGLKFRVLGLV